MLKKILLIILLIFAPVHLLPQTIYEILNSEIKFVYGSSFEVSSYLKIDSSFISSQYNLNGLVTDPYGTLDNCIIFTAINNSNENCKSFVGIYKNGDIKWASSQIISSKDIAATRIFATTDLNRDGNVDILTNWITSGKFAPMYCWIFSWNGSSGYFINDINEYCESVVYTISSADFKLADIEGDGIWEINGFEIEEGEPEIVNGEEIKTYLFSPIFFKWDGEKYIMLEEQQLPPSNFIYPRNNLNVTVKATAGILDSRFCYQFTLMNLTNSLQDINEFVLGLAIDSINSISSPPGWTFKVENPYPFWLSSDKNNYFIKPNETGTFSLSSKQLPYLIKYYVQGYNLRNLNTPPDQELQINSKIGYTIGPVSFWDTLKAKDFLDSLKNITTNSFQLGWIKNETTADKYDSLFTSAKAQLQQNNNTAAKTTLQTVLQQVDIDSTDNLTSEAYALIRYNTEYLVSKIPDQSLLNVASIKPAMSLVNPGAFTMEVKGSGFSSSSVVYFNGNARVTTFVSDSTLNAQILASDVSVAGNFPVWVTEGTTNSDTLIYKVVSILPQPVRPVLECVTNNGDGTYTAFFGYKNDNDISVYIPIGSRNKFTPNPQDRGQTRVFLPGRHYKVYTVIFNGSNLVWTLNGRTSTASRNSAPCQ